MEAAVLNFDGVTSPRLHVGGVFSVTWTLKNPDGSPINLTGGSAELIATRPNGTNVLNMTTANSQITLGGTAGTVTFSLTEAQTTALKLEGKSEGFPRIDKIPYDFWLTLAGLRQKKTYGVIHLVGKAGQ